MLFTGKPFGFSAPNHFVNYLESQSFDSEFRKETRRE
jgi:hypothetical protein